MKRKAGFTLIELGVVAAISLLVITALAPFIRMAKLRANRIDCANNLRKISLGLHMYALDHGDAFPAGMGALYPRYVEDPNAFDCPASKKKGTAGDPDYDYKSGLTEASSQKEIIAQDIDGNHKKSGKNVLKIDGSVGWAAGRR